MGDPDSPTLRNTAAHYLAELLVALQSKSGPLFRWSCCF